MEATVNAVWMPGRPSLVVRLACWFGIYFVAAAVDASSRAVIPRWNYTPDWLFWHVALHFPENLRLLLSGLLGLSNGSFGDKVALVASYTCFLLNFIFCITITGKRGFWLTIGLLVVLVILSFCGSSWYVRRVWGTT